MDMSDFSIDYDAADIGDVKDVHNYLMRKHNSVNENIWSC